MATPSAPRVGLPVTFHPGLGHRQLHGGRFYAAIVAAVSDQISDCHIELVCFSPDGTAFAVWRPFSEAAWIAAGSPPDLDHWSFVDLS